MALHWVYVYYADGDKRHVAFSDTLTESEAEHYKDMWEKDPVYGKVTKVTLEDDCGDELISRRF